MFFLSGFSIIEAGSLKILRRQYSGKKAGSQLVFDGLAILSLGR
jgi:hypothetical protein